MAQWLRNPTRNHGVSGSIPGLAQWVKDPVLLWLWHRPVATAPIQPLAWEPPYAVRAAQEMAKRQQQKNGHWRSSGRGLAVMNLISIHEDMGSIPGLVQWVKDLALP